MVIVRLKRGNCEADTVIRVRLVIFEVTVVCEVDRFA